MALTRVSASSRWDPRGLSSSSFLFIIRMPTSVRSYLFSSKNIWSSRSLAASSVGGSPGRSLR